MRIVAHRGRGTNRGTLSRMATVPSHLGVLQIEPTDHCNLACRMCAPHAERWDDVHGVPKGFLDVELFRRVVDYENIQIQVYLQMLGLVHARLVEQYNNQVLSHDLTRDDELWTNEILPKLKEFCLELHDSMNA